MSEREWKTAGESLLRRELKREIRGGVPHYVTGQHAAEVEGDVAVVSFVDAAGRATAVGCVREDGAWKPQIVRRAWTTHVMPAGAAPDFELSEKMLAAIAEAESRGDGLAEAAPEAGWYFTIARTDAPDFEPEREWVGPFATRELALENGRTVTTDAPAYYRAFVMYGTREPDGTLYLREKP